jgi:choline dehydrogenase-like flavoprotein
VRVFEPEPDLARIHGRIVRPGGPWLESALPLALDPEIIRDRNEAMHFDGFASARGLKAEADSAFLSRLSGNALFTLLTGAEVRTLLPSADCRTAIAGVRLSDGREYQTPRVLLAAGALHSPRLLARYVDAAGLRDELAAAVHIGRYLKLHLLTAILAPYCGA